MINEPNKFFTVLVPCNTIEVQEVSYKHYQQFGTTYKLIFRINMPEYANKLFLCKTNTLHKKEYLQKHGKTPSNTIGMLAEYLELKQNALKTMFKSTLGKDQLQAKFVAQSDRLIKIETTHLTTNGKVRVMDVLYTQTEIHATLKEYGLYWDKVNKYWTGDLSHDQIDELMTQYPALNLVQIDPQSIPLSNSESDLYKVFTIATERHQTVPFSVIRRILLEETRLPIKKITEFTQLSESEGFKGDMIIEYPLNGRIMWRIDRKLHHIQYEPLNNDSLVARTKIDSGDNTKRNPMKVSSEIQVGSCSNSMQVVQSVSILHTDNWEERLRNAIRESQTILEQAILVIEKAVKTPCALESAITQINAMSFGLKDAEKIHMVQQAIMNRLELEFDRRQTKFAVSQAITNVGSHPEDYFTEDQLANLPETTIIRLQELGFTILDD